jgi:hypothetical protein
VYWRKYATQNSYHLSSISVAASESPRNSPTLSRSCWQNGSGATGESYDHKEKERERVSVCVQMCVTCWDIEPCNLLWPAFHFRKESSLQMLVRIKWAGEDAFIIWQGTTRRPTSSLSQRVPRFNHILLRFTIYSIYI